MKIVTIVGARPQFIKAAAVSRAIAAYNVHKGDQIKEVVVHTGQHYDANMSEIFFSQMKIPFPHYRLSVGGGAHGAMTGQMLIKCEEALMIEQPDAVLVYGDTNSTLAGALAAIKLHIPVAHVEAGLRSFNMNMPEEINRILTDRISRWMLCPTAEAVTNLQREGMATGIHLVGDVMYDAALYYKKIAQPTDGVKEIVSRAGKCFYLATIHRAENTDNQKHLQDIFCALNEIASHIPVVMPLHPRTRKMLQHYGIPNEKIILLEPVGYFDMLILLDACKAVFTDSGGVQKEAYFFNRPCVTLRDQTEWTELIQCGCNRLVGANFFKIIEAEKNLTSVVGIEARLYGDGDAGKKIVDVIMNNVVD